MDAWVAAPDAASRGRCWRVLGGAEASCSLMASRNARNDGLCKMHEASPVSWRRRDTELNSTRTHSEPGGTDEDIRRRRAVIKAARKSPPTEFIRIVRRYKSATGPADERSTFNEARRRIISVETACLMLTRKHQRLHQNAEDRNSEFAARATKERAHAESNDEGHESETVHLIGMVHVADRAYFHDICALARKADTVFTELIVPEASVDSISLTLKEPLYSTPAVSHLAAEHDLVAQLDALDVFELDWCVADYTVEQVDEARSRRQSRGLSSAQLGSGAPASTSLIADIAGALIGARYADLDMGESLLRTLLWLLVPAPELGVLLLDWARSPAGARPAPVLQAVLGALVSGDVKLVRKLVFAQLLVSEQRAGATEQLVRERSERALAVMRQRLARSQRSAAKGPCSFAILYGAMHLGQIAEGLLADGFNVNSVRWLSAWEMDVTSAERGAAFTTASEVRLGSETRTDLGDDCWHRRWVSRIVVFTAVPAVLAFEAADWVQTLREVADGATAQTYFGAFAALSLYLVRHAALYLIISKWALEWNRRLYEW